jgi:hypothetical protein
MRRVRAKAIICGAVISCSLGLSAWAAPATPVLVQPDGSYPTVPLEKDVIVVKVVQHAPLNLQKAPSIKEGLATNVERMASLDQPRPARTGKKPDFILFNEFPLTGYSAGTARRSSSSRSRCPDRRPSASANSPRPATPT